MRQNIDQANELRFSTTKTYREHKTKLSQEIAKIQSNFSLSGRGKAEQKQKKRETFAKELITLAAGIKAEYMKELDTAKKAARKVLNVGLVKPDDETLSKFERSLADVKTALMLSPSISSAQSKLQTFLSSIDDAYLADRAGRSYPDLLAQVTSKGKLTPEAISGLSALHTELSERFKSPEQREAAEFYKTAEEMEQSTLFPSIVEKDIKYIYGRHVSEAFKNPEKALADIDNVPVESEESNMKV